MAVAPLKIADREFTSRLILGTGKFASPELMRDALEASGTEMVTVALRRADLSGEKDPFANILEFIDPEKYLLLPNTSGAMNAEEAVRLARLAVAAGFLLLVVALVFFFGAFFSASSAGTSLRFRTSRLTFRLSSISARSFFL